MIFIYCIDSVKAWFTLAKKIEFFYVFNLNIKKIKTIDFGGKLMFKYHLENNLYTKKKLCEKTNKKWV